MRKTNPTEAEIVKEMIKELRKRGCECSKIHGDKYQEKGVPDIMGCNPKGKFFTIEAKRPGKEKNLSPYQKLKLKRYSKVSKHVGVATTIEQALKIAGVK